jgi:group I intron endonuclease
MNPQDIPATSGIYKITCLPTSKFYIGSTNNLFRRWYDHRKELRRNDHGNQKLQNAWNKYGEESFTFEVLELVLPTFQIEREQYWLDKLKPWGNKGLNIARNAQAFSLGLTHSPESRAKMSAAKRGKPSTRIGYSPSPATREKLRRAGLGKKDSPETRAKRSASHMGLKHPPTSEATKAKQRLAKQNTSDETRARMSLAHKGKPNPHLGVKQSDETREKHRLTSLGRVHSPETRAKNSASNIIGNEWRMRTLIVTFPDGTTRTVKGIKQFCKEYSLHDTALIRVAQGKQPAHKGYKARYAD